MKHIPDKIPLKTILINFLNHVSSLENQRSPDNTYESEFQELKLFSESIKGKKQHSCSEGEKEVNRKKNRYKDILPFDASRVVLKEYAGVPGSDYINANFIKGASGSPAYIASQGPLPNTVNDFWRMVVQCEVQVIVMACNEEEAGKHKCENYWVEGEGEEKQFGMVSLRLIKASTVCPDFSVRTMRIKYLNSQSNTEERTVCQFHYSAWPDHGVPPLVKPLLDMVRLVRDTQASETLPVLIHCSAGCGRTGTICAIDYVWGLLRAGKLTKDFSLLTLVREMRRQRIAMVQTKEQYVLVHQAVRELFREQLRMIDSHPYENIDCNGLPLVKCPSPEPTYVTIQNNNIDEKQDDVEKELAPPLPQKKRFHTLSSKQAKEVENLSERKRLAERAGSSSESVASTGSSGQKPRIATLRSLFERQHAARDSRQVSRSHSTGSVRSHQSRPQPQPQPQPQPKPQSQSVAEVNEKLIPGRGILRVPKPALPVKRSKSMRVLGSSDRSKLSIPPQPSANTPADVIDSPLTSQHRRLSLESNFSEIKDLVEADIPHQNLSDFLSVDSIVAGLGVRERRNSFRRAVRSEAQDALALKAKKPGLLRSYTSVDMRSTVDRSNVTFDPPKKPFLHPKPSLQTKLNRRDDRRDLTNLIKSNQTIQFSAMNELKKQQLQSQSSHHPMSHSTSLRIAPKVNKEDCRVLLSPSSARSYSSEPMYSSGESTKSGASSDHSLPNTLYPKSSRVPKQSSSVINEVYDFNRHNKHNVKSTSQYQHPREGSDPNTHKESKNHLSSSLKDSSTNYTHQKLSDGAQSSKGEVTLQQVHPKMSPVGDIRKHPPLQNTQTGLQDTRGLKTGSNPIYGSTSKASPPPYVEPGKSARKPRSSQQSSSSSKQTKGFSYEEIYGKSEEQKDWKRCIPPELLGAQNNQPNSKDSQSPYGQVYSKNLPERKHTEQNTRHHTQEIYSRAADYSRSSHLGVQNSSDQRRLQDQDIYVSKDRANVDQDPHLRSPHNVGKANDRRFLEQNMSSADYYYSSKEASRGVEQNNPSKTPADRKDQTSEGIYVRSANDRRTVEDLQASGSVRMRRGSRDDLALCATTPSRVKRHASVVLMRHSLIEGADTPAASPLTVWSQTSAGGGSLSQNTTPQSKEDPWSGAVGVDLDQVAASITTKKDGKLIRAALEALHLRKASTPRKPAKSASTPAKQSPAYHATPSTQYKPGSISSSHYPHPSTSGSSPSAQYKPSPGGPGSSTPAQFKAPLLSGGTGSTPPAQYKPSDPHKSGVRQQYL